MIINGENISCIKVKPVFMQFIPLLNGNTMQAIYPYIYIPKQFINRYNCVNPDKYAIASIVHELEHLQRQKEFGLMKWLLKYIVSSIFRIEEEYAADFAQMKYLKHEGLILDLHKRAEFLSGWNYLWPDHYENVLRRLKELWDQA